MAKLRDTIVDGDLRVRGDIFVNGRISLKDAIRAIRLEHSELVFENFNEEETRIELGTIIPDSTGSTGTVIDDSIEAGEVLSDSRTWSINRIVSELRNNTNSSVNIRDDLMDSKQHVWSISKVVEKLNTKVGIDQADEIITEKVTDVVPSVLEDFGGLIKKGENAPQNTSMFWLDTLS